MDRPSNISSPSEPGKDRPEDRGNELEQPQEDDEAAEVDQGLEALGDIPYQSYDLFIQHMNTPPSSKTAA